MHVGSEVQLKVLVRDLPMCPRGDLRTDHTACGRLTTTAFISRFLAPSCVPGNADSNAATDHIAAATWRFVALILAAGARGGRSRLPDSVSCAIHSTDLIECVEVGERVAADD